MDSLYLLFTSSAQIIKLHSSHFTMCMCVLCVRVMKADERCQEIAAVWSVQRNTKDLIYLCMWRGVVSTYLLSMYCVCMMLIIIERDRFLRCVTNENEWQWWVCVSSLLTITIIFDIHIRIGGCILVCTAYHSPICNMSAWISQRNFVDAMARRDDRLKCRILLSSGCWMVNEFACDAMCGWRHRQRCWCGAHNATNLERIFIFSHRHSISVHC